MKCEFFVVPRNGHALLGMPDTVALKIININIDSIEAASTWKEECNTNIDDAKESDTRPEAHVVKEGCTNMDEDLKVANNVNRSSNNTSINTLTSYFLSSPNIEVDKRESIELTQKIHSLFDNVFNGIGCFKGTFPLQLRPDSKPYQVPLRWVAYPLQKPFKDELDWLQKLDVIIPLGIDETVEGCNSFVFVPKANGKVRLCLDPVRLNQALIRPIHTGPTLNDIWPRLINVQYMSIIDTSLGYHDLKLGEKLSCLTTFTCPFGRYQYKQLLFGAVLAGDMFQCKIDEIFSNMHNVFGIAEDILVIGYDENGADHDAAVHKVLWQCEEVNLKLNKEKCHFRYTSMPFFEEVISREGVQPDPQKIKALTNMLAPNNKNELQAFLGIINYLVKFSPGTTDVCDPLCKPTSSKVIWTWNVLYQALLNKAELLIKSDMCMKFMMILNCFT